MKEKYSTKYGAMGNEDNESNEDGATFEQAISATKFGKFNILLLIVSIPARWSSVFETTTMSYVFPSAQCDLDLNLSNKGLLNAITYIGMISSGFLWGYLCDTFGRKKLMFIGFFLDTFFVLLSSLSQNFTALLISKFLGGLIINGPFAALTCYLSEFHSAKYRARVQMILGLITSTASICLPLLAGFILPSSNEYQLFNYLTIHPWNLYLLVAALPSLAGGVAFLFLPESPKFLMTKNKNDEALKVLSEVYKMNTGNYKDRYPIKKLLIEQKNNEKIKLNIWEKITPLFKPPLLKGLILACSLQTLIMMSTNTLRLWLPQLFQSINDYELHNNGTSASLCKMLEQFKPENNTSTNLIECKVENENSQVYINTMIVAIVTLIGFLIAGSLINILGKKKLLFISSSLAGLSGLSLYFAQSTKVTLILSSCYIGLGSICINIILSVVVDLFPTSYRTMTIALSMMIGRMGAVSGNLIFPYFLSTGCGLPFISIGCGMLGCAILSLFLPNTDMKSLQ